jgi:wyosine [tRNA(Phe)-imidazoG37] synthetase (radical SAM superfamily)
MSLLYDSHMDSTSSISKAISDHSRSFLKNRYVYPVLSRRSNGVSVGINLNPDKICNFDCIYCQVDRPNTDEGVKTVEIDIVLQELKEILNSFGDESLFLTPIFKEIPKEKLVLRDIAFSGDGEPSLFPGISDLTQKVISLKNALGFSNVNVVMITNATGLSRPDTLKAIDHLDSDRGIIWAKLDAGTDAYFHRVCRTGFQFSKILDNILLVSQIRPIVIQTCFMKINKEGPSQEEIRTYCQRLLTIKNRNGRLKSVQIYTVARRPTEAYVEPLENIELDQIVEFVRRESGLSVKAYYHL